MGKHEQYELESILSEIHEQGFTTIKLDRLYRLLGKGNRAVGTWRALLDVWEGIGGDRTELHIAEFCDENDGPSFPTKGLLLITKRPLERLTRWAGE